MSDREGSQMTLPLLIKSMLSAQLKVFRSDTTRFGIHNNIVLAWDFNARPSKDFSKQALNAIPHNGPPDLSRYRYAQTMVPHSVLTAE